MRFDLALSTDQALHFLDQNPRAYNLIISDMNRGGENDAGIKLLAEIRNRWDFAPAVLIYCGVQSARAFGDKAKALGAVDVTSSVKDITRWIEHVAASLT